MSKWKQFISKRDMVYIGVWVFTLFCVIGFAKMKVEDSIVPFATYIGNKDEEQFVYDLTTGMSVEQKFFAPRDFSCMTLSCSDHEMRLSGKTYVEVTELKSSEIVFSKEINNTDIFYNIPLELHFEGKGNQTYLIRVTGIDTGERAIGLFGHLPDVGEEIALVDGEASAYALSVGIHDHTELFSKLLFLILAIAFVGFGILLFFLCRRNLEPEKIFLLIAIPMGISLLCFQSVNFIHDGDAHFAKAYHYSNVLLRTEQVMYRGHSIAMRQDDADIVLHCNTIVNNNSQNMNYIIENWRWFVKDASMVEGIEWNGVVETNLFVYFPSVIGIIIARLLHLGTYPMILLAKIAPFVLYLFAGFYAIKIVPIGKQAMLFLAALPMSLQQATGITYDNMSYMILFLMIALTLKIYYAGIDRRCGVVLALLCTFLGFCKGGVYIPMLLLLLCIPAEKMETGKKKWTYILFVGCLTLMMFFINYGGALKMYLIPIKLTAEQRETLQKVNNNIGEEEELNKGIEYLKQIDETSKKYGMSYILREPIDSAKLILRTIVDKTEEYYRGILGRVIAWPAEEVPNWAGFLFGIILLLAINRLEKEPLVDFKLKIGMMSTFGSVILAHCVVFLSETSRESSTIWGLQGRYFIPQLLLFLLCIRNNCVIQKEGSEKGLYILYDIQWIFYLMGYYIGKGF